MWDIYCTIGSSAFKDKEYLIDEVGDILDHMNDFSFMGVLGIMFGDIPKTSAPLEKLTLFIKSAKKNNLHLFDRFVKGLLR